MLKCFVHSDYLTLETAQNSLGERVYYLALDLAQGRDTVTI